MMKWTVTIIVLLLFHFEAHALELHCNQQTPDSDADVWQIASQVEGFREWFAHDSVFNLPEDDWIKGWGYRQLEDPVFPFNKMLTSSFLLTYGIEPISWLSQIEESSLAYWTGKNVTVNHTSTPTQFRIWRASGAILDQDMTLHIFGVKVMNVGGELIHYSFSVEDGWTVENVSQQVSNPASSVSLYWSKPTPYIDPNGTLHVFADTYADDELVHYYREPGANWQAENVTKDEIGGSPQFSGRPMIVRTAFGSDPNDVAAMQPTVHVFGADSSTGKLSHYRLSVGGTWTAATVDPIYYPSIKLDRLVAAFADPRQGLHVIAELSGGEGIMHFAWKPGLGWVVQHVWRVGAHLEWPRAVMTPSGQIHVVGIGPGRSGLVHWRKLADGGWSSETITPDRQLWAADAVVDDDGVLHVFASNFSAELIHYRRSIEGQWSDENITTYQPNSGNLRMWIPVAVASPGNKIDIFGDTGEYIVHYYWSKLLGGLWLADNFGNRGRVDSGPTIVPGPGEEQHVFAVNDNFELIYLSKLSEPRSYPWHDNDYYRNLAEGSEWGFKYVPRDQTPEGSPAVAQSGAFATDQVEMACGMFEIRDNFVGVNGTANRAAVMLHEATHIRYGDMFGTEPHAQENPQQDEWYHHGVSTRGGYIYKSNEILFRKKDVKHSMLQLQIEYLSDIGEFPNYWVPYSVYGEACDEANQLILATIEGDPGWRCGELRPFP